MSNKSIGGICGIISMAAVAVYLIWGMIAHSYQNAWIVFVISGIACAAVSIINNIKKEEKAKKAEETEEQQND